jgi:hypothetical protein
LQYAGNFSFGDLSKNHDKKRLKEKKEAGGRENFRKKILIFSGRKHEKIN